MALQPYKISQAVSVALTAGGAAVALPAIDCFLAKGLLWLFKTDVAAAPSAFTWEVALNSTPSWLTNSNAAHNAASNVDLTNTPASGDLSNGWITSLTLKASSSWLALGGFMVPKIRGKITPLASTTSCVLDATAIVVYDTQALLDLSIRALGPNPLI